MKVGTWARGLSGLSTDRNPLEATSCMRWFLSSRDGAHLGAELHQEPGPRFAVCC